MTIEIPGTIGEPKKVEFFIVERDAQSLVSQSIYDEKGVIVGQKPQEDYEIELEDMRGKTVFECQAVSHFPEVGGDGATVLVPKTVGFRSAIIEQELRAGAMAEMFAAFGSALFTGFFKR